MTTYVEISAELTFLSAFEVWIDNLTLKQQPGMYSGVRYISERTEWDYRQYARALGKFFGALPLREIHEGHIREYHRARAFCEGAWDRQAGANRIRKEVFMLIRILVAAGVWNKEQKEKSGSFRPLQREEQEIPRALSPDEQMLWLNAAASKERWSFILHYSVGALQTCISTDEMRAIRLSETTLQYRCVTVPKGKNWFRARTIPLETDEALWAFEMLLLRAKKLGANGPYHYLLPYTYAGGKRSDPTKAMSDSGLKKKWEEVRVETGLRWFRPYDLRHTGITRYAEKGTPIAVIMSFAGHMSLKMQQHYTHISNMAMRKAAASTWGRPGDGGQPMQQWRIAG